ncbi:MAG: hypothetical protein MK116_00040 [Phycisphaerales bacterium]|nr:hypothetical protein [Phycisphaerales bacterium]
MQTAPTCVAILGLAAAAMGGSNVLLDQIGPNDGSEIGTNILASQIFEPAFSVYDIAALDDFEATSSASVASVAAVISGWNGYAGFAAVSGARVSFWDDVAAAGVSLAGNVCSNDYLSGDLELDPDWGGVAPSALVQVAVAAGDCDLGAGVLYASLIPVNEFGSNGQTGAATSNLGDFQCWQANPAGGFGFGPTQVAAENLAIRVLSGSGNPCDDALDPDCPGDVSGPAGVPDGFVGVDDILMTISTYGQSGDGTFRPQGDCYPLPNGDCQVNVDDVLQVINEFGKICADLGGCCFDNGDCTEGLTEIACGDAGGAWLGADSTCDTCASGACCLGDASCQNLNPGACETAGGNYLGDDSACGDCPALPDNNDCANALEITSGNVSFDNTAATTSGDVIDPCGEAQARQIYQDLWYRITAVEDGDLIVSTCNATSLDTIVAIYDDCGGTVLGCNDDGEGCADFTSYLSLDAIAGDTFVIRIGSYAWGDTASFDAIIEIVPETPGACCVSNIDCFPDLLPSDCDAFGGVYQGAGSDCDDVSCGWPGCTAADTPEGVPCQEDTDAAGANADPNGGNNVDPPSFGSIAVDESICGSASTFTCAGCGTDGADATYRDTDWYAFSNPEGGAYTVTFGGEGPLLAGIVDLNANSFAVAGTSESLAETTVVVTLPAGDNYAVFVAHDFNAGFDTPCGSNLDQYTVSLTRTSADPAACCFDGTCLGDLDPVDCADQGGTYVAGESCASGYQCPVAYEGCTGASGSEPLDSSAAWTAGSSDATYGYIRYASMAAASMSSARVWGLTLAYNGGWEVCSDPDMNLAVGVYEDDGSGLPGTALAEASLLPNQAVVDVIYAGVYPLHRFDFDLPANGNIRWLKAASESDGLGDCWLLWISSTLAGEGTSLFDNQGTISVEDYGLAHCIYE